MTVFKVARAVEWDVLGFDHKMPSTIKWTSEDPLAIEITFGDSAGKVIWLLSRDMFIEVCTGRCDEYGNGDVHLAKRINHGLAGGESLVLTLNVGHVISLKANPGIVNAFLQETLMYSPYGEENLDLDTTITKLLEGECGV
jgi:hypothetical protein